MYPARLYYHVIDWDSTIMQPRRTKNPSSYIGTTQVRHTHVSLCLIPIIRSRSHRRANHGSSGSARKHACPRREGQPGEFNATQESLRGTAGDCWELGVGGTAVSPLDDAPRLLEYCQSHPPCGSSCGLSHRPEYSASRSHGIKRSTPLGLAPARPFLLPPLPPPSPGH
jgi:hypothetical protein